MPFNPSEIVAQLDRIFGLGVKVLEALRNAGINFDKVAMLHHDPRILEFKYSLNIGMNSSRAQNIKRKFKSKLANKLEIASDGEVYLIPAEDISPYVRDTGKVKIIDISRMFEELSSSTNVFIRFKQTLSADQARAIFPIPHALMNPQYLDDNKRQEIPIEIICDFGRYWNKQYDSFKITDTKQTGGTRIHRYDVINKLLPEQSRSIVKAAEKAKVLDNETMLHLQSISRAFKKFETDEEVQDRLSRAFIIDKPRYVRIEKVWGIITELDISGRKLTIPYEVKYALRFELEGREAPLSATLAIDNCRIEAVIRELAEEI